MHRRIAWIGLLLLCCSSLALARQSESLNFTVYAPYSGFSPYYHGLDRLATLAIRSEKQWRRLWKQIEPRLEHDMDDPKPHPLPSIDFDRYVLLVFAAGSKPNGGFVAVIDSVREAPSHITVTVSDVSPGPNCILTTSISYPIAYALIERVDKPIRFEVNRTIRDCTE